MHTVRRCFGPLVLLLVAITLVWLGPARASDAEPGAGEPLALLTSDASSVDTAALADAACSPPPQCWRDRDCDSICGKRNGVCVVVNSCTRECACKS